MWWRPTGAMYSRQRRPLRTYLPALHRHSERSEESRYMALVKYLSINISQWKGSEGSKEGSEGSKGGGIAYGDEFIGCLSAAGKRPLEMYSFDASVPPFSTGKHVTGLSGRFPTKQNPSPMPPQKRRHNKAPKSNYLTSITKHSAARTSPSGGSPAQRE